jgi:hypothetical protein
MRKAIDEVYANGESPYQTIDYQLYRFAWGNREIPKGTILRLLSTGKLNSVMVEEWPPKRGHVWITDRRALRRIEASKK